MEELRNFRDLNRGLSHEDIRMLQPLQLAYIGDAVYEVYIRTYVLGKGSSVNELHGLATKYVKATSQAAIVYMLEDFFTEEEKRVIKRGRNSKSHSIPKNVELTDYKYSTGFESLIGYLYLREKYDRIDEIISEILRTQWELNILATISKEKINCQDFRKSFENFLEFEKIKCSKLELQEAEEDSLQLSAKLVVEAAIYEDVGKEEYDKIIDFMEMNKILFIGGMTIA